MGATTYSGKVISPAGSQGESFTTDFFSHNPARLNKDNTFNWDKPVDPNSRGDVLTHELDDIKKTLQVTFPVRSGYSDAVFALQEAHEKRSTIRLDMNAVFYSQNEAMVVESEGGTKLYYPVRRDFLASWSLDGTKVTSIIPRYGKRSYETYYLVTLSGGQYSDNRKGISQVIPGP